MIEAQGLSKRYGAKSAVDGISFSIRPGVVTGFLGPNGAGKSTTMRMIMGLDAPSAGGVSVNGKPYAAHRAPLHEVGALLDAKAVHNGRSARNHLRLLAATHGISAARVSQVISMAGLETVAGKRVGGFSLGMGQRLGIAAALLGDPHTVIFDEPVNGLDPEGVIWVRTLARSLAKEGRTVFLSSHLMSEMSQTADHLLVIGRGRIVADAPMRDVLKGSGGTRTRVRTDAPAALMEALGRPGREIRLVEPDCLEVDDADPRMIASVALERRILVWELTPLTASLEEAYLDLTKNDVEYQTRGARNLAVPAVGESRVSG